MAPEGALTAIRTGLLEVGEYNFSWPGENGTSQEFGAMNYTMPSGPWYWPWCPFWKSSQHILFQLSNALFVASFAAPSTKKGQLWMHSTLILAFMLYSVWSWHVICAPDAFSWNFAFVFLNLAQVVYIVYEMRPVKFDPELEEVYHTLFEPFKVGRLQFKRMVSGEFAQIMSLHAGEAYAMQNLTKTDRLGLLLSGKVNVMNGPQFLHPILPCEFLDSPEFESSRATIDEKFKVSIVAASSCRYLYWQRSSLEYLFIKETYLGTVVTTLIARDITTKLYAMNNKIVTDKGSHLDIRLPSITSTLAAAGEYRSPPRFMRAKQITNTWMTSPESVGSGGSGCGSGNGVEGSNVAVGWRGQSAGGAGVGGWTGHGSSGGGVWRGDGNGGGGVWRGDMSGLWRGEASEPGGGEKGRDEELEPLTPASPPCEEEVQAASSDELSVGQDSCLDTSSKYHSCEAVETDEELRH